MARPPSKSATTPDLLGDATAAARPEAATDLPPLPARYEDALAELESLVTRMEAGQLPLDQLMGNYQRGAQLLQFCRSRLEAIESQVKVLEDGQLKPWEGA